MEPAAPGTEDDTVPPTLSKKASDDERLLSIKSHLPSGRYGNVFSKSYNDGMEQWYCNICECPVMGRMFHHETGKRHTQQIGKMEQRQQRSNKDRYGKDEKVEEEKPFVKEEETLFREMGTGMDHAQISVAPGEPVPPGVEGDVTKVAQIQERLDKFKASALLGLEYLLEITDYDINKEPSYLCALCDKKGDPRTVIAHLVSYNHLQQFLQRHFPATYRALSPYITRQYRKNWQDTMNSIAEAIECKYGRLLPHPVDKDTFEKKKDFYYQVIHMGPHFSEKNGVTFETMVKPEEITKNIEDDGIGTSQDTKCKVLAAGAAATAAASKKRSPSPPVVAKPKRVRSNPDNIRGRRSSLSSVSSISSGSDTNEGDTGWRPRGTRGRGRGARGGQRRASTGGSASDSGSGSPDRRNDIGRSSRSRSKSRSRYQNTHNPRYNHPHRGQSFRGGYQTNRGAATFNPHRYNNNNNNSNYRRSPSPRQRSPPRNRSDSRPPWERSNYSTRAANRSPPPTAGVRGGDVSRMERAKLERENKVEEFSRLCKAIDNDMGRVLKGHEKNPEKHPQYSEEWKLFWNRRYKELQLEGKDAASYDFKPEWIVVWNKRMMELHNADIKTKKDGLRKRLGLREEPAPISFRIGKHSPTNGKGPAPVAAQPDQDHEVIIIDDKDDDGPKLTTTTRKTPTTTTATDASPARSHSPWETDVPLANAPPPIGRAPQKQTTPNDTITSTQAGDRPQERSSDTNRSRDEQIRTGRRSSPPSTDYPPARRPLPPTRVSRDRSAERSRRSLERSVDRDRKRSPLNGRDRSDTRASGGSGRGNSVGRDREQRMMSAERRYEDGARFDGRRSRGDDGATMGGWERRAGGGGTSVRSRTPSSPTTDRDRYYRDREYFERERSWERVINRHREMRMVPPLADVYRPPIIMRDVTSAPMHYVPANLVQQRPRSPEIDIPDEAPSIVSVLRLLTALEETLGSLGPKVIDLLASALALEKNEPNSAEMLLDNEINCVMFETVKEKLKGRLQAGLVTYKQEKAVKHAIKSLASLIHDASERKRIRIQQSALNPLTVPGVGVVDKAAIAKQIATALVLQGKTDVSQTELEQLINAVVGMAEASRHMDTPINTATFLTQCHGDKPPAFTPKIIIPTVVKEQEKERAKLEQQLAHGTTDETLKHTTMVVVMEDENSAMEGLSDSDLQTLLQNFKDLSTDEQHGLISYLRKLEAREPQRVEMLRQFVNMGRQEDTAGRMEDGAAVRGAAGAALKFDSDEEEYSYEDVFKVAKQNVTKREREEEEARRKVELEEEERRNMELNLDQAKMIIANLMDSMSKENEPKMTPPPPHLLGFIPPRDSQPQNKPNITSNQQNTNEIPKTTQICDNPPINYDAHCNTTHKDTPTNKQHTQPSHPTFQHSTNDSDLTRQNTNMFDFQPPPINMGAVQSPINTGGIRQPMNVGVSSPMSMGGVQSPINMGSVVPPMNMGGVQSPMNMGGIRPPMDMGGVVPPMNMGGVQSPMNMGGVRPPMGMGGQMAPFHGGNPFGFGGRGFGGSDAPPLMRGVGFSPFGGGGGGRAPQRGGYNNNNDGRW